MRYDQVRELLLHHLTYSGVNATKAHEIYHDDAILEFPGPQWEPLNQAADGLVGPGMARGADRAGAS